MKADPNKVHVPTATEAAKWLALATVAMEIATGASRAWHELARLAKGCDGRGVTVFGVLSPRNACVTLVRRARAAAESTRPRDFDTALKLAAEAVIAAYYDWEADGK